MMDVPAVTRHREDVYQRIMANMMAGVRCRSKVPTFVAVYSLDLPDHLNDKSYVEN